MTVDSVGYTAYEAYLAGTPSQGLAAVRASGSGPIPVVDLTQGGDDLSLGIRLLLQDGCEVFSGDDTEVAELVEYAPGGGGYVALGGFLRRLAGGEECC